MSDLERATRRAYDTAARAWATGPERVYRPLASALLDCSPRPLPGALMIDIGSGTGVLGELATKRGARCVETDVAVGMLAYRRTRPRLSVAADGRRLPVRNAVCDIVTAACSLSHIPDPVRMAAEAHRVLRGGGALLASAFPPATQPHPVRDIVEAVLEEIGYVRPAWYQQLKDHGEPQVETAAALLDLASRTRFEHAEVVAIRLDTGVASPAALVDWRLGMAQYAHFISGLDHQARRRLREAALASLGQTPPRLMIDLNVLIARRPKDRSR